MPSFVLGKNAKAYFNTTTVDSGNHLTVLDSATEADNIKDLTLNLEKGEADISTRGDGGWTTRAATLKDGTIDFQMRWETSDPFFTAVKNSFLNDTEIAFFALDGAKDVAGSQGLGGNFQVFTFTRNENLTEALMVDVSLRPSSEPDWVTSSS